MLENFSNLLLAIPYWQPWRFGKVWNTCIPVVIDLSKTGNVHPSPLPVSTKTIYDRPHSWIGWYNVKPFKPGASKLSQVNISSNIILQVEEINFDGSK